MILLILNINPKSQINSNLNICHKGVSCGVAPSPNLMQRISRYDFINYNNSKLHNKLLNRHNNNKHNNEYNTTSYFSCRQGYRLIGKDSLYCNHEGVWTGSLGLCEGYIRSIKFV